MAVRYSKESIRIDVKFVRESTNDIILTVPITMMELQDYFKTDYVYSVMKNTFGEDKLKAIGDVRVLIDQKYIVS